MTDRAKIFTIAEANALLPRLNIILEQQMALLAEIDQCVAKLREAGGDPSAIDPLPDDSHAMVELKTDLRTRAQKFREGWAEVESLGVVVKDVRQGLIDFHGRRAGQVVWLCWKYGEPAVAHWHALDQGFSSRQPLERLSIPPTMN